MRESVAAGRVKPANRTKSLGPASNQTAEAGDPVAGSDRRPGETHLTDAQGLRRSWW